MFACWGHTMVVLPPALTRFGLSYIFNPSNAKLSVVLFRGTLLKSATVPHPSMSMNNGVQWQHTWLAKCIGTAGEEWMGSGRMFSTCLKTSIFFGFMCFVSLFHVTLLPWTLTNTSLPNFKEASSVLFGAQVHCSVAVCTKH